VLAKRCLSPNPADRPGHAGEVAQVVAKLQQGAEARYGEATVNSRLAAEQRKVRLLRFALAAACGLLVLSWSVFAWYVNAVR
jgi:hypothetical protein